MPFFNDSIKVYKSTLAKPREMSRKFAAADLVIDKFGVIVKDRLGLFNGASRPVVCHKSCVKMAQSSVNSLTVEQLHQRIEQLADRSYKNTETLMATLVKLQERVDALECEEHKTDDAFGVAARRIDRLQERVTALEAQAKTCDDQVTAPLGRPSASFPHGTRVGYKHIDCRDNTPKWLGRVIPRPANCDPFGKQGPLVWVMKDCSPHNVVGCYPWNLEKL